MNGSVEGLSKSLAAVVRARIAAGVLSGAVIVRRCLISQSHVSNWLAGRRTLSACNCDQVLAALRLSAIDVLAGRVPAPGRRLAPVLQMPGLSEPRRGPAVAVRTLPAWRRRCGLQVVA